MSDKSSLLDQLRIDRDESVRTGGRGALWAAAAVLQGASLVSAA